MTTGAQLEMDQVLSLPVLDQGMVAQLREEVGEDLELILELYLEQLPGRLAELARLASLGQMGSLKSAAHQLKGSSRNLGALRLGGMCQVLEQLAMAEGMVGLPGLVGRIEEVADQLRLQLEAILAA